MTILKHHFVSNEIQTSNFSYLGSNIRIDVFSNFLLRGGERLNVHTLLTLSLILAFIFVKWSKMLEHLKNIYIRPQSRCTNPASRTDRPRGRCTEPASEPDFL